MAHRVLVLFASDHGHTAKVADRIGTVLERTPDVHARVRDIRATAAPALDLAEFTAVIVAASVHGGQHQHAVLAWIGDHRARLNELPTAFVSVSLTAADDADEARATVRELIDDVLDSTGWTPRTTLAVAGAFQFHEYNLPTRVIMRLIARRVEQQIGRKVDVHEDTDYTDWPALDHFAETFAEALRQTPAASA